MKNIGKTVDQYEYCQVFSKILEKILFNRLSSIVQKYNILTDAQYGFRGIDQQNPLLSII
jgi:hypothetical protein